MIRAFIQRLLHLFAYFAPGGERFRPLLHRWRGVNMGDNVWIGPYVWIDAKYPHLVSIGSNVSVGLRTSIIAHLRGQGVSVVIEDDVFIGPHCVILPDVKIGKGAVIRGGSVVTRNVPAGTMWGASVAEPIAKVTVPLAGGNTYEEFIAGMRPIRRRKPAPAAPPPPPPAPAQDPATSAAQNDGAETPQSSTEQSEAQ